jgi:hypothetical protein
MIGIGISMLGLCSGYGSRFPGLAPDSPTLIIDFVPTDGDSDWVNMSVDFTTQTYQANQLDPVTPGFINLQSWS